MVDPPSQFSFLDLSVELAPLSFTALRSAHASGMNMRNIVIRNMRDMETLQGESNHTAISLDATDLRHFSQKA